MVDGLDGAEELLASALFLSAELALVSGEGYDAAAVARGRALLLRPPRATPAGTTFDARAVAYERSWDAETFDALRAAQQADLATFTPQGRQVIAEGSSHHVPSQRPTIIIEALESVLAELGG